MGSGATWLGVGVKSGGQLLIGGVESEGGFLFNLNDMRAATWKYSISSSRWGLGLGGSGGLGVMFIFNSNAINWLNGEIIRDWGINIALGKKWDKVFRFIKDKRIHFILKQISKNPRFFLQNLDDLRDFAHIVYNASDVLNSRDQHPMVSFDVPGLDVGWEISAFKKSGKIWVEPL